MRTLLLLAASGFLVGCSGASQPVTRAPSSPTETPASSTQPCVADGLPPLDPHKLYRSCKDAEDECRAACERDEGEACFGLALELQQVAMDAGDPRGTPAEAESNVLFRKACQLGSPNACTNHAAHLWRFPETRADVTCAQRVFEATCETGDPFGCGMSARLLIEKKGGPDEEELARGRAILERSCIRLGGFPCHVLALYYEWETFGAAPEGSIDALMQQACDGGDTNACGDFATVEETFHR